MHNLRRVVHLHHSGVEVEEFLQEYAQFVLRGPTKKRRRLGAKDRKGIQEASV